MDFGKKSDFNKGHVRNFEYETSPFYRGIVGGAKVVKGSKISNDPERNRINSDSLKTSFYLVKEGASLNNSDNSEIDKSFSDNSIVRTFFFPKKLNFNKKWPTNKLGQRPKKYNLCKARQLRADKKATGQVVKGCRK